MFNGSARRSAALALGLLSLVLLFSVLPFITGVLGAPVLYVLFAPVYRRLVAHFGLYFLLVYAKEWWLIVRSWIPFSPMRAEHLRIEFHDVTYATIWGILLTAVLQGTVVGLAFWLVGLQRPAFWGIVTAFLSVLPILGSALVWAPGAVVLLMRHQPGAAITLALIGFIVASNIDNIAMLVLLNRVSGIHPLVAIIGVFAGARLIGIAGVLLGPLMLAYFLELLDAFSAEYKSPSSETVPADRPPPDSDVFRVPALSTVGPAAQEGP